MRYQNVGYLVVLALAIYTCTETNKYIDKHHSDDVGYDQHKAPVVLLSVLFIAILIDFVMSFFESR